MAGVSFYAWSCRRVSPSIRRRLTRRCSRTGASVATLPRAPAAEGQYRYPDLGLCMRSAPHHRFSPATLAAIVWMGIVPARPAWAHGEQLLVNFGVAFVLIPLWLYITRWQIRTLPEESRRQTWSLTWAAAFVGFGWALFGSNLVSSNAFLGPPLSFGALSITSLPAAVALFRNRQVVRCFSLLGIPVVLGVLAAG
jgi:hypothetical protein